VGRKDQADWLSEQLSNLRLAEKQFQTELDNCERLSSRVKALEESQRIIQEVASQVQQQSHQAISEIVTKCLKTVFGDDSYEFGIDFTQKRGRTEAELYFTKDGERFDPTTSSGGGVCDVAAFALRVSCLVLSSPAVRRILVLDEPMRFVSKEFQPIVRDLLEELSERMGIQIILVTHSRLLECGKVIEL